ncbi:MAG: DUF1343 domain-containing protein [Marinilabiliales bacterium]|nr:MAG: DUF1343 domain-containing protein [Marinilabiliales bacterium]
MSRICFLFLVSGLFFIHTKAQVKVPDRSYLYEVTDSVVINGAEACEAYFPLLKNKRIGLVVNHTSMINDIHLVDSLHNAGFNIVKIFAPEHGFRGNQSDGAHISDSKDNITGATIVSLFGSKFKPTAQDLADIDIVLFDIQDVGVRFYTFISTMHYVMEACAENNKPFVVLDRPNPNGHYIDGPMLDLRFKSFIGMDPIPLVHGLTVGELATMINGEGWLGDDLKCDLTVIQCKNYNHSCLYKLPIMPSPNLVSMDAVYLYPSLGLLEGTVVSVGRGTYQAFEIFGHPLLKNTDIEFTPESIKGMSENPKFLGQKCYGFNVKSFATEYIRYNSSIYLYWLLELYAELSPQTEFWRDGVFDKLAGSDKLRTQIEEGLNTDEITSSWLFDLQQYKHLRKKYLLYPDFE